jgi:hypothetical protein
LRLHGDGWRLILADAEGRSIELSRCRNELQVERKDLACPFLDAVRNVQLASGAPVNLWLDVGSIELLADDGAAALTMQHLLSGATINLWMPEGHSA